MITEDSFTKIKHDTNGNPRYVIHFLPILSDLKDKDYKNSLTVNESYELALGICRKIGGRKFHNKSFGGGIVFTTYNLRELANDINERVKGVR